MLDIGKTAPDFSLLDEKGQNKTLKDFTGNWTVVYFYPKDDTPGCTKEACTITEVYEEFSKLGVVVVGVSKDSPASHKKFKDKYSIPFILLSEESTEMIQAYEAWSEKSMFGKKYMGISRVSYILDPEGKVVKVYPKVSPDKHALELLKDLQDLI